MEEIIKMPQKALAFLELYPIIDNIVIPGYVIDLLTAGKVHKVDVLAGVCTHEGYVQTPFLVPSLFSKNYTYEDVKSQLKAYLKMVADPISMDNTMAAIENAYIDTDDKKVPADKLFEAVVKIIGDQLNTIPTYHMVELVAG